MNQDQFLERLWSEVIEDPSGRIDPLERGSAAAVGASSHVDLQRVARDARWGAVFDWCLAFDEADLPPAAWLQAKNRWRWRRLVDEGPSGLFPHGLSMPPDSEVPFPDGCAALERLSAAGVPEEEIRDSILRSRRAALDAVLAVLRAHAFGPNDLAGLHESLTMADPSDLEGGARGPSEDSSVHRTTPGTPVASTPICRVRRSHCLAFSPDGSRIVAATGGAVTEVGTGRVLATCRLLANTAHVAWSPDGRWIAATNTSGKIALCDAATGARKHVLEMSHEGGGAVFSPDGARVYAGDWSGFLFAWDVASGREVARRELPGSMVHSVRWARDRDAIDVVACVRPEPSYLVTLPATLATLESRIDLPDRTLDAVWDPDRRRALVLGREWLARVDDAGAVTERSEILGAGALETSPDGRWCALAYGTGFRVGPTADLTQSVLVSLPYASRAAFSADSTRVALATWHAGEVWEIERLFSARG